MRKPAAFLAIGLISLAFPTRAQEAKEDVPPSHPFKAGQVISYETIDLIKNYIPEPFWEHRDFFFFEGMNLEIGPLHVDYGPSEARKVLTAKYAGQARIGRDDSLENYLLGRPFPHIDPDDPQAGIKHAWNMDYKHDALEGKASFYYSYWDNGEALPLYYKGTGWLMRLSRRTDQAERKGDIFRDETRKGAGGSKSRLRSMRGGSRLSDIGTSLRTVLVIRRDTMMPGLTFRLCGGCVASQGHSETMPSPEPI